jgi:GT2 family glycosyltransferase
MTNIFILNWNSAKSTCECINSIMNSDTLLFRIILINNFSTNSDLEGLRKIYHFFNDKIEIYLIENTTNLGYAGGNNEGLKFLMTNNLEGNILILNPDTRISNNTISEMEKAMIDKVGIVTVRTLDPQGKIIFDAIKLKGFFSNYVLTQEPIISTDYSQGSCLLINRDIIDTIGLFDERFFLYWEEVDFSLRVKYLGFKLISITSTQIIKNINEDIRHPAAIYYSVRNARLIKNKHKKIFSNLSYYYYLFKMFFITLKYIRKPGIFFLVISSYFSAIHDSFLNIYNSKPSRNKCLKSNLSTL